MPATSPIEHVLVLVLENRAFDHMLGFLPRTGALAKLAGLTGSESNLRDPFDPDSQAFPVRRGASYKIVTGRGPAHQLPGANVQLTGWKGGPTPEHPVKNNGFVASYIEELTSEGFKNPSDDEIAAVMEYFTPEQMPAISTLAREFCLCDHWFSSVPGPTMPNRLYIHAATSAGYAYNDWGHEFGFRTVYNNLEDAGRTWRVYYSNDNEALKFSQLDRDHNLFRLLDERFYDDVAAGDLPSYSYLVPRFLGNEVVGVNTEHAPSDVRCGEHLLANIYNALRANPGVWEKCLFVLIYDEHGGFYDHVAPPANVPNPDGLTSPGPGMNAQWAPTFDFTRLGLRVPAILVSPWIAPSLDQTVYEHASISATLKRLWDLPDYLTKRDKAANSFERWITGDGLKLRRDCIEKLPTPELPSKEEIATQSQVPLDDIQRDILSGAPQLHPDPSQRTMDEVNKITTQAEASAYMAKMVKLHLDYHTAARAVK